MEKILLLGSGSSRDRRLLTPNHQEFNFDDVVLETVDFVSTHKPTYLFDLNDHDWICFGNNVYDEVHAYEVLEHLGTQGNFRAFFRIFTNIWNILKPGGFLCASVPSVTSRWAWGDPGHTRVIMPESLTFLSQKEYAKQVGHTAMSDYRRWWKGDFEPRHLNDDGEGFTFILEAIK